MIGPHEDEELLARLREKLGMPEKKDERAELERIFGKRDETTEDRLRDQWKQEVPQAGEFHAVGIDKLAYNGDGFGTIDHRYRIFVPGTVPGDTVRVEIVESTPPLLRGRVVESVAPSSNRSRPRCSHFGSCPGCHLQQLSYPAQLRAREVMIRDLFREHDSSSRVQVRPLDPSPEAYGYRLSATLCLKRQGTGIAVGYASGKGRFTALTECPILSSGGSEIVALLPRLLAGSGAETVHLLSAPDNAEWAIRIVGRRLKCSPATLLKEAQSLTPAICGIICQGSGPVKSAGTSALPFPVGGVELPVSPGETIIENRYLLRSAMEKAVQLASPVPDDQCIYFFPGAGLLAATLARFPASMDLVHLPLNGCQASSAWTVFPNYADTCSFYSLDEESEVAEDVWTKDDYRSLAVIEAPAAGCPQELLQLLIARKPGKLLYISRVPQSMARDMRTLMEADFRVRVIQPLDLYPHNAHVLVMVFLTHRYTATSAIADTLPDLR